MNLAKALKLKNRYIQKISELQDLIRNNNCFPEGKEQKVDVKDLMHQLDIAVHNLIRLKIMIFEASAPIRGNILTLAELKSRISFLRNLDTREGSISYISHYPSDSNVSLSCCFDVLWVNKEIEECNEKIDVLQEEIDSFNYKTEIEL